MDNTPAKIYSWYLSDKKYIFRQGVIMAESKREVENYLNKSFCEEEKEFLVGKKLTIKQLIMEDKK